MKQLLLGSLALLALSGKALALEVDEKLTLRVLKLSETRKTMLINRGTEDGLAEGDHAKFYVSAGVVARGVVVKVSPSRSVWSVYRLVNADLVVNDAVMSLKISPPVKLTQDESRTIIQDDTPTSVAVDDATKLGIPLAEGANDLAEGTRVLSEADRAELLALQGPGNIRERNLELWTALSLSSLGSKSSNNAANGAQSFSGSDARTQLALNLEYYVTDEKRWWARFSPFAFVNVQNRATSAFQGSKQAEASTEFGAGLNWHPWSLPSMVNHFIPFLSFSIGMGSLSSSYEPGVEAPGGATQEAQGSTMSYALGAGYKFYTNRGFGARAILDFYTRTEKLSQADTDLTWDRTSSGPRLWVGMGYRW